MSPVPPTRASAPGKMMLSGEYAVLEGAPAVVAAVQRRATVEWTAEPGSRPVARGLEHADPRFPEVAATRRLAGDDGSGELLVDVSALRGAEVKLGLGSSAAAAAAAAALVTARAGAELDPATLFDLAFHGHAEVAPQGSGADVAASVHGGYVVYHATSRAVTPVRWPEGLVGRVVFTGQAASTRELVGKVRALDETDHARYVERMDALAREAAAFARAFREGASAEVIASADRYGRAMAALGEAAGAPIVEERLARLAALARSTGGAAKPSGAGGGDVAIAFFPGQAAADRYAGACRGEGFEVLEVELGGPGARIEGP